MNGIAVNPRRIGAHQRPGFLAGIAAGKEKHIMSCPGEQGKFGVGNFPGKELSAAGDRNVGVRGTGNNGNREWKSFSGLPAGMPDQGRRHAQRRRGLVYRDKNRMHVGVTTSFRDQFLAEYVGFFRILRPCLGIPEELYRFRRPVASCRNCDKRAGSVMPPAIPSRYSRREKTLPRRYV